MTPCLVIVANLCFHDVAHIDIQSPGGLGTRLAVHGTDYSMTVDLGGDNVRTPDWRRMHLACNAGTCVAYYKRCEETTLTRAACEYHFSQPGDEQNTTIQLVAPNPEALAHAESSVGILTRTRVDLVEVSLKSFSVEGPDKTPPYCERREPQTRCWRS
jgi:hypothetical protein